MHGHNRAGCRTQRFEFFERRIGMLLNQFIQRGKRVALVNRMSMASGKRSRSPRLIITEKPALEGADVDAIDAGDLLLRSLMGQVGRDGPLPRVCFCYFHAANSKQIITAIQSLNALALQRKPFDMLRAGRLHFG